MECCHFVSVTLCRWHMSQIWLCTSYYEPVIFCSSLVESETTCVRLEKHKFNAKEVLLLHRFWNICSFSLFLCHLLSSLEVSFRRMVGFIRSLNGLYIVCCLPPDVKVSSEVWMVYIYCVVYHLMLKFHQKFDWFIYSVLFTTWCETHTFWPLIGFRIIQDLPGYHTYPSELSFTLACYQITKSHCPPLYNVKQQTECVCHLFCRIKW